VIRVGKQTWPMANLGDVCEIISGQSPEGKYYNEQGEGMPFYQGKTEFTEKYLGEPTTWTTNVKKVAEKDDILMSVRAPVGPVNIATQRICVGRGLAAIRPDTSKALLEYVFINLKIKQDEIKGNSGSTFASINRSDIAKIQIPLLPLETQRQLVDEIAAHQRIIDGARQVVEGWKPNLELELDELLEASGLEEWEMTTFSNACLLNPK
jgi:restriction endonuclease S subunit